MWHCTCTYTRICIYVYTWLKTVMLLGQLWDYGIHFHPWHDRNWFHFICIYHTVLWNWFHSHYIHVYHTVLWNWVLLIHFCLSRGSRFGLDVTSSVECARMSTNSTSTSSVWRVQSSSQSYLPLETTCIHVYNYITYRMHVHVWSWKKVLYSVYISVNSWQHVLTVMV